MKEWLSHRLSISGSVPPYIWICNSYSYTKKVNCIASYTSPLQKDEISSNFSLLSWHLHPFLAGLRIDKEGQSDKAKICSHSGFNGGGGGEWRAKKLVCRCFSSVWPVGGRRAAHSQAKEEGPSYPGKVTLQEWHRHDTYGTAWVSGDTKHTCGGQCCSQDWQLWSRRLLGRNQNSLLPEFFNLVGAKAGN